MQTYLYRCKCGEFELKRQMSESSQKGKCPECGRRARRIFTAIPIHWGFTLSESSHHEGNPDELVSNKPSNEGLVSA